MEIRVLDNTTKRSCQTTATISVVTFAPIPHTIPTSSTLRVSTEQVTLGSVLAGVSQYTPSVSEWFTLRTRLIQ